MRKAYYNKIEKTKFEIDVITKEIEMFMDQDMVFKIENADILKKAERRLKYKDYVLTILCFPKRFID